MERHINLVAYLHIAYGALLVLSAIFVFVVISGSGALSGDAGAFAITTGIAGIIGTILIVLAIPAFIVGFGLLRRHDWSRVLTIIMSIIYLFSVPIGTIIGGYSLWVMMQDETRDILSRGPI